MTERDQRLSRRKFLASAAAVALGSGLPRAESAVPPGVGSVEGTTRKPIAVVATVYRPYSDAYHIAGRFLHGYPLDGRLHLPNQFISSLYVDQKPENDLSREIGRTFGVRVCRTIDECLTHGSKQLAVEGVLLIAEHGNYPRNEREQILYPRHEMFHEIVEVFRRTGQSVPVFVDRQLSHSWENARAMVGWAKELGFPMLAGSSLPVAGRRLPLELPIGAGVDEVLVTGYGPVEVFGFHALEALQSLAERRAGGETGVQAVTCLTGRDVWRAGDQGRWGRDLLDAALAQSETADLGDVRLNAGRHAVGSMPRIPPLAFLLEYRSGLKAAVLLLNGHVQDFCAAVRIKGESRPLSCLFPMPGLPGARHFDGLVASIERLFQERRSPWPIERNLLTTSALAALMDSRHRHGIRLETPALDVRYVPADNGQG